MAVVGVCVLVAGFAVGRLLGGNRRAEATGSDPTVTSTRSGAVKVPMLGAAKPIPTLDASTQEAAAEPEPEAEEEAASSPVVEEEPPPQSHSEPEVTVAPNG